MQEIINFLKYSRTLHIALVVTVSATLTNYVARGEFSIAEVIIAFFVGLFVAWAFIKPPKKSQQ